MRHVKRTRRAGAIAKAAELAMAAPQVVAVRSARMLAAAANPGTADRVELSRMCTEKVRAFWESVFAMNAQIVRSQQEYARAAALQWWRLWTTSLWLPAYRSGTQAIASLPRSAALTAGPTRRQRQRAIAKVVEAGLTPIHKRATANARRLGRVKKR
jgi:hypothetical protein